MEPGRKSATGRKEKDCHFLPSFPFVVVVALHTHGYRTKSF